METTEFTEEIDFQKYWLVLKRRWLPATAVFGSIVTLAALATTLDKVAYEARGKLLFQNDRSSSLTGVQNELGEIKPLGEKSEPLQTEAEIIRSLPIAQMTVERIEKQFNPQQLQAMGYFDEEGKPLNPKSIAGALEVKPVTGTDVLEVGYQADDPTLAAVVVNKVMEVYKEEDIKNNQEKARTIRQFIEAQIPDIAKKVTDADKKVREYKERYRVVDLESEAKESVEIVSEADKRIAEAEAKLADATARSKALREQVGIKSETAVALASANQSPAVQQLITQLQDVQGKLAIERSRFSEANPAIDSLRDKEANLKALLQERVGQVIGRQQPVAAEDFLQQGELRQELTANLVQAEVERLGWENQLNVLRNVRTAYKTRSENLPKIEQNLRELERQVTAFQATYEKFLNRLDEAKVAENQTIGNARVVAEAQIPQTSTGSKKKIILVGGFGAGLMLAIATAFLLDLIDRSVKTVKEAKELFGYTLLGVIPAFGKAGRGRPARDLESMAANVYVRDFPYSPINEAYQMLQANLKFLSSDKELKAIVVTSSVAGEGKSEVSANLAATMAQVGRRVLLVDANMRHPSQHHVWKLTNAVGLSNILVGEVDFRTAVREVMPGLDVLSAGVIPPNPVALLESKRMASLIESFSKKYDFVIVDTPSLAGIADAPILGKMTDGILLVVRPGVVDSSSAKAAKDFLARSGQNVLGLVANGVIIKNEPDSYFYYTNERYTKPVSASKEQPALSASRDIEAS